MHPIGQSDAGRPLVSVACQVARLSMAIPHDGQSISGMEKESWDWIELISSGGKGAKDGKVQDDNGNYDWDNIESRIEGIIIVPIKGDAAIPSLQLCASP